MKEKQNLISFYELTSFENLYKAHKKARMSKRHKWDVINFESNLYLNLIELQKSLREGTYKVGKYKSFYVYEPKKREIQALGYVDRVVQHAICDNYLVPYYERRLIFSNCACRTNKGAHFARQLLKQYIIKFLKTHKNGYVLKCDIKKYFANLDHNVIQSMIDKYEDNNISKIVGDIISSYNAQNKKGVPIGNQVSQIMGIAYLDKIDRLIKEKLKIKYYVRYMDDLILVHEDKEYLKICFYTIEKELKKLKLIFNKKTQYLTLSNGFEFLGAKYISKNGKVLLLLKKQTKKKFIKNKKIIKLLFKKGKILNDYISSSYAGINGHVNGFNCYNFCKALLG